MFATVGGTSVALLLAVTIAFGVLDALHNPAAITPPRTLVRTTTSPRHRG